MGELHRSTDVGDEGADPGSDSEHGTPRWAKVFAFVALVVILLFVVLTLVGGGEHGPGRHTPGDGSDPGGSHTGPPPGFEHGG
jgi:hypothetical protein